MTTWVPKKFKVVEKRSSDTYHPQNMLAYMAEQKYINDRTCFATDPGCPNCGCRFVRLEESIPPSYALCASCEIVRDEDTPIEEVELPEVKKRVELHGMWES